MRRLFRGTVMAASAVLVLSGCATLLAGRPVSVFDDPFKVAGLPATGGPSGLREDAPGPTRDAVDSDGGEDDTWALQSVSDLEEFWKAAYEPPLEGTFEPVDELISWDSNGYGTEFCGEDTAGVNNAAFCPPDNTIGWDRGGLVPDLRRDFGDMAIPLLLGHEYGHSLQRQAALVSRNTPTLVREQQADCFAGVYMRWVVEGNSPRFTLNTSDGLNNVLAAMISLRDPVLTEDDHSMIASSEHGSAFERVSAFQFGFTDGAAACAAIDEEEIAQRRGDLPVALPDDVSGELEIDEESVQGIVDALNTLFSPANPPELSFSASQADSCTDARPSPPASYCPATNTIVVDVPGLQELGEKMDQRTGLSFGDNTAYSILTSRYMLAIQQQRGGLVLDNADAALRTACLTGVASAKLSDEGNGTDITLTAGDLDEAVSGMLTNGLAASDVNGDSVPAGFSRIDAFRTGVLGDVERCIKRYP